MPEQPIDDPSAVLASWVTAFNDRDLGRICRLYADDAVLWGTFSSSLVNSPPGVRAYFSRAFEPAMQAGVELQGVHLQTVGSVSVASGSYLLKASIAGHHRSLPARFTFVLARTDDGWRIANHHSSLTPP